jgi:hypothetical protein
MRNRAVYLLPLILLLLAGACGPNAKQKALRTTLVSVNAARDGFVTWDYVHQQGIVDDATSLEDGKAKLKAYREKREKAVISFEIAYRALAVAALDLTTANVGEALRSAGDLYMLIRALMGKDTPAAVPPAVEPEKPAVEPEKPAAVEPKPEAPVEPTKPVEPAPAPPPAPVPVPAPAPATP